MSAASTAKSPVSQEERSPLVLSVVKAFHLLETIAAHDSGLTLGELSKQNDLHPSTAHRLLHTLIEVGFVRQEPRTRSYQLGAKAFQLVTPARQRGDVASVAAPLLRQLAETVEETANLYVLEGVDVVHVAQSESPKAVRMMTSVGTRLPVYCSASGKALLANLPSAQSEALLAKLELVPHTPNTVTDLDELRVELDRIRRRGYAVDDEEQEIGVRCVGAAVRDHAGFPVTAISVSGPSGRITVHRLAELAHQVQACAAALSHALRFET